MISALKFVTKDWARQRKAEERVKSREANRCYALLRRREWSIKQAAYAVMDQAYMQASSNGTLVVLARQIMYKARPLIQEKTDKPLDDKYFTQTLLPDYMNEHNVDWDVVFDERGHFTEPHTQRRIGLGTLKVRDYLGRMRQPLLSPAGFSQAEVETLGAQCCFGAVLFIEKEGFQPLLEQARIAERYDVAIMSTKGISNTAARKLVDVVCGQQNIPLLVLHDFDIAGFSIVQTLRESNRRYAFGHNPTVIDIGLRLEDVKGLETEMAFNRWSGDAIEWRLGINGATEDEIEFLKERRVELNAFASDELIRFIERKLGEIGIKKILPARKTLAEAYRMFVRSGRVQKIVEAALAKTSAEHVSVPKDLENRVREILRERPEIRWDHAVSSVARAWEVQVQR
jgi:hypothetical protein